MKLTERLSYLSLRALLVPLSLLPLGVLYVLSDLIAWLMADVFRYRRTVVGGNIDSALPELTGEERRLTARRFYSWLADYFVETVKLTTMPRRQMARRMTFGGGGAVAADLAAGRSVTLYLGHYCNWEWISSIPMHFPAENAAGDPVVCGQIYHPLENAGADRVMLDIRSRFGAVNIEMNETLRVLLRWRREGRTSMVGYISDQVPNWNSIHRWCDFLHHDTPVFNGAERIARRLDTAVYYIDVYRPRRGYYRAEFVPMAAHAADTAPGELTDTFYRLLETTIRREPAYWLWSHKRWKRTRRMWHDHGHTDAELQ